jgi:hypothetical protein
MGGAARLCFVDTFFVTSIPCSLILLIFGREAWAAVFFYGPVPNVLGFVYSHCPDDCLDGRGRDILVG